MTYSFMFRVMCCGSPVYEGRDVALAQRIFEHLATCAGHHTVLEELNTDDLWERVESSPNTETHHPRSD